jgi:hypothetical protein
MCGFEARNMVILKQETGRVSRDFEANYVGQDCFGWPKVSY